MAGRYKRTYEFRSSTRARGSEVRFEYDSIQGWADSMPDPDALWSNNVLSAIAGGSANALTATLPVTWASWAGKDQMRISIRASQANTGAVTLDVNGMGPLSVVRSGNVALIAGDLIGGAYYDVIYSESDNRFYVDTLSGMESRVNAAVGEAEQSAQQSAQDAQRSEQAAEQAEQIAGDLVEHMDDIEAVAANIPSINTVAGDTIAINAVAANAVPINALYDDLGALMAVYSNLPTISSVNGNEAQINTVAAMYAQINTVAALESEIWTVAMDSGAINAVNANISPIISVDANETNINAVAGDLSAVITTANNMPSIIAAPGAADRAEDAAQLAEDLTLLYLGGSTTDPAVGKGGAPLVAGNWYINTVTGFIRAYTGSAWVNGLAGAVSVAYADILNAPFDTSDPGEALSTTPFVTGQFSDAVTAIGNTGTSQTLQPIDGGYYTATLTANCTFTLDGVNAVPGRTSSLILKLRNDATASRSVTFVAAGGGSVVYPGGSLDRTTTANRTDVYFAYTDDGANWVVSIPQKDIR